MSVTRRHTAYHEAGHAVIATLVGYTVDLVTIVADAERNSLGYSQLSGTFIHPLAHRRLTREVRTDIRDHILHMLAGEAAEDMATNGAYEAWRSEEDRENAADFARYLSRQPERYVRGCRTETRRLLRQHWEWIEAVAERLLVQGTLTGDEVRALESRGGAEIEPRSSTRDATSFASSLTRPSGSEFPGP